MDLGSMEKEARKIASWGENAYIKNTCYKYKRRKVQATLVKKLSQDGLKLNVTAILTIEQVKQVAGRSFTWNPQYCFGVLQDASQTLAGILCQ